MKKCIYPLVIYADKEENCYAGIIPDLDISASGDTVEETFASAVDNLKMFLEFAYKVDSNISLPSTYQEVVGIFPKRIILLANVEIENSNITLSTDEQAYKDFFNSILVDKEN